MLILPSSDFEKLSATVVLVAVLAVAALWLGFPWPPTRVALDFEECVEYAQDAPSDTERSARTVDCGARFAGRRKAGGGYTYYDFLQNRSFDIAGPNPTEEERKHIDSEYVGFLESERREAVSAGFAKRRIENLLADIEDLRAPVGPPTMLTPKNPPAPKTLVKKPPKTCAVEGSLSCTWAKLTSAVRNALASNSKPGSN